MEKIIIAAIAKNGTIGINGKIPWHSAEELKHFKRTTFGFPVLMGRKTFESIRKPLEGRLNIVISKTLTDCNQEDFVIFDSLEKAYIYCESEIDARKIFIIGGGSIFGQAIKEADMMIISKMKIDCEGNVFFPQISPEEWAIDSSKEYDEFELIKYKRKDLSKWLKNKQETEI